MLTHDQKTAVENGLKKNEVMSSKQKSAVRAAIGNSSTRPKMTNDARVNCQVDVVVCKSPPWQNLSPIMKALYKKEAEMFAKCLAT